MCKSHHAKRGRSFEVVADVHGAAS